MNKMKNFVKQFVAVVKGDDAEAQALKALRQADSALKTQIASLKGDTITYEDKVTEAKEKLEMARVNSGKLITSRDTYVRDLLTAKNNVTIAVQNLETHQEKIAFLEGELALLDQE